MAATIVNTEHAAELPEMIMAAEVHEFKKPYTIHQIPTPTISDPYDILIRVAVAAFCHTDMMILNGEMEPHPSGFSGSHEPTGTIVSLGASASSLGFKPGDRIAAEGWRGLCGKCADCLGPARNRHYCKFLKGFCGSTLPGGFQEYTVVDARFAVVLPDALGFVSAAPLTCAGATAWRAVKNLEAEKGEWVGIVGSGGGLGHLAIQFATGRGYKVLGVDARDEGLALSKKAGADAVVDVRVSQEKLLENIRNATGGTLMRSTIVLSDHPTATGTACAITEPHSVVIQVAQPEFVSVSFRELVFRDITLKGSLLASQDELEEMVAFVAEKKVHIETTSFSGLESLPEVIEEQRRGKIAGKMVVVLDESAVEEDRRKGRM